MNHPARLAYAVRLFKDQPRTHLIALNIASMITLANPTRWSTLGVPDWFSDHIDELVEFMRDADRDHVEVVHSATTIVLENLHHVLTSTTFDTDGTTTVDATDTVH